MVVHVQIAGVLKVGVFGVVKLNVDGLTLAWIGVLKVNVDKVDGIIDVNVNVDGLNGPVVNVGVEKVVNVNVAGVDGVVNETVGVLNVIGGVVKVSVDMTGVVNVNVPVPIGVGVVTDGNDPVTDDGLMVILVNVAGDTVVGYVNVLVFIGPVVTVIGLNDDGDGMQVHVYVLVVPSVDVCPPFGDVVVDEIIDVSSFDV